MDPKLSPAKFGAHTPYGTGNNGVCNISSSSISNSNSNVVVPMPRLTNGRKSVKILISKQLARAAIFYTDRMVSTNNY